MVAFKTALLIYKLVSTFRVSNLVFLAGVIYVNIFFKDS